MGANAQIAVPSFTAGQILTATQQTQINTGIPVFATTTTRDAAFGGTGEKTLAQGQYAYIEATSTLQVYTGAAWVNAVSSGLNLITAQTIGSAVGSVTVSDCFSATYNNYKILVSGGTASSNTYLRVALGAATTNYYNKVIYGTVANNTVSGLAYASSPGWDLIGSANSGGIVANIDLYNPFATTTTNFSAIVSEAVYDPTNIYGTNAGVHNASTSFTGFTLSPLGGTITGGTIRVYGYANS